MAQRDIEEAIKEDNLVFPDDAIDINSMSANELYQDVYERHVNACIAALQKLIEAPQGEGHV